MNVNLARGIRMKIFWYTITQVYSRNLIFARTSPGSKIHLTRKGSGVTECRKKIQENSTRRNTALQSEFCSRCRSRRAMIKLNSKVIDA